MSPFIRGASHWSARAVAVEHFHVAGVGRGAVEHFAGPADAAHFLGTKGIFEIGKARAFEPEGFIDVMVSGIARRHEQVPDAGRLGAGLFLFDHLQHFPAPAGKLFGLVVPLTRADVILDELAHAVAPVDLPFGRIEIHQFLSIMPARAGLRCDAPMASILVHLTYQLNSLREREREIKPLFTMEVRIFPAFQKCPDFPDPSCGVAPRLDPVDDQRSAGDERGFLAGEEQDRTGDVLSLTTARDRLGLCRHLCNHGLGLGFDFAGHGKRTGEDVGVDEAGLDRGHADAVTGKIGRGDLGQMQHARLGHE
jgi:hypothetical protein